MIRTKTAECKSEIASNRECCENELNETLSVVAEIKENIRTGRGLNYNNYFEREIKEKEKQRGSLLDDYADTSSEMPDYTGGDD